MKLVCYEEKNTIYLIMKYSSIYVIEFPKFTSKAEQSEVKLLNPTISPKNIVTQSNLSAVCFFIFMSFTIEGGRKSW